MYSNNSNGRRAARARGFVALFAMLAMGLGLMARPAEAAPFAYVPAAGGTLVIDTATHPPSVVATIPVGSFGVAVTPDGKHVYVASPLFGNVAGSVFVIDTATNTVVATVPVAGNGIAITPDGTHAYVTDMFTNNVSVIDTASNTVVGTPITVGIAPFGVAITPDGKHAYVANKGSGNVSVIDTATNTVLTGTGFPIAVGSGPVAVAITPDGKQTYVPNFGSNTVSVIDTATNKVTTTITVGMNPGGVAVTPDGKHAYVANDGSGNVSVIDTATNTVLTGTGFPIPVGGSPIALAVTPDGKHAYVASNTGTVSVIDTATNTVVGSPVAGNNFPNGIGIIPPPPGVPFLAFGAVLNIDFGTASNTDAFTLGTSVILSSTAPVFNPLTDPVTLHIGTFAVTIPAGSFKKNHLGHFIFLGVIDGVTLQAVIKPTGTLRYTFEAGAQHASLTGTQNTVYVTLAIGGGSFSNSNSGATSVTAAIFGTAPSVKAAMSR
jgi:YVTN family beta-propeller protein